MITALRSGIVLLVLLCAPLASATTWFVRPDGGSRFSSKVSKGQCDGKADTAYPGKGSNQHCAFNDVRYMWMDGSYGNSGWVMSGGDTLVIRGCAALPSQQNPDAPHCRIGWDKATGNDAQNFWCAGVNAYCSIPPPPSGTASQHTKILGGCAYGNYRCNPVIGYPYTNNNLTQLFGGFGADAVLFLTGSQFIDIEGLEITSHNGRCTTTGSPAYPSVCSTNIPATDSTKWGIIPDANTRDILLQDVYIHGFTAIGLGGPIGGAWTLNRVSIDFNAFAGWNFDSPNHAQNGPHTTLTQSYVTMVGNGCLEEYPIVHKEFPAKACWDSNSAGFGDTWSGQEAKLDSFTCDHCLLRYNVKDAAIGPHTLIHNLSLTNSVWIGNMGQAGKWGQEENATFVFQNNLIVGNCMRMADILPGAAQNFNQATGLKGSYLTNYCRAAGGVFDYFAGAGSTVNFTNNSIVTYQPTIFQLGCYPSNGCRNTPYHFTNNLILGYRSGGGDAPSLYYKDDSSVQITGSHNLEYGVRNGDGCGKNGNLCADPRLINEPPQKAWTAQSFLDGFNFTPGPDSPAVGHGLPVSGLASDALGGTRPVPASIGAVEHHATAH